MNKSKQRRIAAMTAKLEAGTLGYSVPNPLGNRKLRRHGTIVERLTTLNHEALAIAREAVEALDAQKETDA